MVQFVLIKMDLKHMNAFNGIASYKSVFEVSRIQGEA